MIPCLPPANNSTHQSAGRLIALVGLLAVVGCLIACLPGCGSKKCEPSCPCPVESVGFGRPAAPGEHKVRKLIVVDDKGKAALTVDGNDFRVRDKDGKTHTFQTDDLVAALRFARQK